MVYVAGFFLLVALASDVTLGTKRLLTSDPSYVHSLELKVQELNEKSVKTDELLKKLSDEVTQLKTQTAKCVTTVHLSCPTGFMRINQSCYKIHHDTMSWPEAFTFCKAFGAHLYVPNTKEEHNLIKREVLELQAAYSATYYWVAASDAFFDGQYILAESDQAATGIVWALNEPNGGTHENCAAMAITQKFDIIDVTCITRANFICEIE